MLASNTIRYTKGNNANKNKKSLNLIHWNANSLNNKKREFDQFILNDLNPDIVSVNETKLSDFRANMLLNYENYNIINKSRHQNKNGAGGIAILLKKNINFIQIVDNAFNELEIIVINIFIKNITLTLVSYYNAPHLNLNIRILEQLNTRYQNLIILGDLNSKAMSLGCKSTNANGILLEELIINSNLLIANNKDHTYFRTHDNSSDILDW